MRQKDTLIVTDTGSALCRHHPQHFAPRTSLNPHNIPVFRQKGQRCAWTGLGTGLLPWRAGQEPRARAHDRSLHNSLPGCGKPCGETREVAAPGGRLEHRVSAFGDHMYRSDRPVWLEWRDGDRGARRTAGSRVSGRWHRPEGTQGPDSSLGWGPS